MVGIRIHVIHYLVATPSLQQREEPYQVDAVPLPHIPNTIRDKISVKCIRVNTPSEFVNHGSSEGNIYSHTCMHTCVCIFIYVIVNNLIDTNVFSLLFGFFEIWVCFNRLRM